MIDYTLPLDQLPDPLPIEPLRKPFDVTITPPGSKSITCRAYVLAALAQGESKIIRPLRADDPDYLLKALCTLGAEARWVPGEVHDGEDVYIKGVGGRFPRGGNLYMGDGGAPTRFMIACACLAAEPVVIDASPRMRERPIAEGVEMLRQLGARIEYVEEEGRLPVRVTPSEIHGGDMRVENTITSQSVSAVLLIGGALKNGINIEFADAPASETYVVLTLKIIDDWGPRCEARIRDSQGRCRVFPEHMTGRTYSIEPDASSAAFFITAATLHAGSKLTIPHLWRYSDQPDTSIIGALDDLGVLVYLEARDIVVEGTDFHGAEDTSKVEFNFSLMPDAAITFGCCCATQKLAARLTGLRTLRVKETDRIAALANELRKVDCTVGTGEDWISIDPTASTRAKTVRERSNEPLADTRDWSQPVVIETYNDHRMAMAFAVLGLARPGISISNPACVKKSYPGFWKDFAKLYR